MTFNFTGFKPIFIAVIFAAIYFNTGAKCFSLTSSPSSVDGQITACPGTLITLICMASDVGNLAWKNNTGQIGVFLSSHTASTVLQHGPYTLTLVNVENDDGDSFASFVSTLEVMIDYSMNGTKLTCAIFQHQRSLYIYLKSHPPIPSGLELSNNFQQYNFSIIATWDRVNNELTEEYTIQYMNSTLTITNTSTIVLEGFYNVPLEFHIWAVNCVGSSSVITKAVTISGCGVPRPPINGSIDGWNSSQISAKINYNCDSGFVLNGEGIAICSLPSLEWIPGSSRVHCTQLTYTGKCETPQFLTNFNSLFNEHNGSLSCNDGYYPPATLNCQCEHGRWIILPDEVKCVSYSNQQEPSNTSSVDPLLSTDKMVIIIIVVATGSFITGQLTCLLLCYVFVCFTNRKKDKAETPTVYEEIQLNNRSPTQINVNEAYGRVI